MSIIEFTFNYDITYHDSLNQIYSGKHWTNRKIYSHSIHMIVKNALSRAGFKKRKSGVIFLSPVCITITFPFDGLDIDNHSYFTKCVVDGLKGVVIKDDSPKCVIGLMQKFEDRKNILVEVEDC